MITHKTGDGRTYHHNGDFSGEVYLIMKADEVERIPVGDHVWYTAKIPTADLVDIIAEVIRNRRIEELEDADSWTLLGLPPAESPA